MILIYLICFSAYSQDKIDSYSNNLNEIFTISTTKPDKKNSFTYYFECSSIDRTSKQAILMVESTEIEEFKMYILFLKETFEKFKKTAIENNVTDVETDIDYKKINFQCAFSYGGWNISNAFLTAKFKVIKGKSIIVISSNRLISSTNKYIKSDGFIFSFEKSEDFDDIIEKLNNEDVILFYKEQKSKEDLFKN